MSCQDPTEYDQISTLPNGLRVATEALPGPFSAVGVYVDAGSRYETEELSGVSHIVDRLAFKSTNSRSSDEMLESMENLGGNIQCASSRESMMYQSATFNTSIPAVVDLLAETVRNPKISEEEVSQQLETAEYEINEIWSKPELILPELINVAAYRGNTLGNPLLCPQERIPFINKMVVEKYRKAFYKPDRIVLAFAGVKHEKALQLAEEYFGDMPQREPVLSQVGSETSFTPAAFASQPAQSPPSPPQFPTTYSTPSPPGQVPPQQVSRLASHIPFFKNLSTSAAPQASISPVQPSSTDQSSPLSSPSHYTGGFLSLPKLPPPVNPALPDLTYIHLGFEALPISSDDIYALATLQTLLGGGGSFSAGGPGKGMYSRLYTNVLNQHGWVESCICFNNSYTDSGLFGISASCDPTRTKHMIDVMCRELHNLTLDTGFSALQTAEVNRAKNQLRSALLMNLESRMVELEDLGRQVQVHGKKVGVKEMCAKIDALTVKDLRRVARMVFGGLVNNPGSGSGAPTIVLQEGHAAPEKLVNWEMIQEKIAKWNLGRR
ncbi:uncharacterized protein KY384_004956 [Bacidia gigantensis]|uniref:uncharacterized protein n=1 Tax=Bacidia gigantensis TaxID=2732470 RepID=UPI001D05218B|nr:uncharacterized protein KY384_004956 [Bacidia gigantensis]KAG8530454.1 hypothetical protein KY384_004956 [Bacidia gigantensis]